MQPKVQLSIPEPCHEDWGKMTATEQGKFCNACAKEVVDFTTMSDTEVLHYFLDKKNEKVCGRMYPDQLNRSLTKPVFPEKKKWWQWQYAAMLLLLLGRSGNAKAQGAIRVTGAEKKEVVTQQPQRIVLGNIVPPAVRNKGISGTVTDEHGEAVPGALVQVKGTAAETITDPEGHYKLAAATEKDILLISAVGFEPTEVKLKNNKAGALVITRLKMRMLGEIVVAGGIDADYTAVAVSHTAVVEVLDNSTRMPVKAAIAIVKNSGDKTDTLTTNTKGICSIKRIKENDSYTLTVTAEGYLPASLDIKGWTFNSRKEKVNVMLERQPVLTDYKKLDTVALMSYGTIKGKIAYACGATTSADTVPLPDRKSIIADTLNAISTMLGGSLKIAPNPVIKGSAFTLQFTVKKTGRYIVQISNGAGQSLQQQQVDAPQKNNRVQVQTDARWGSGVYFLRLFDTNNNLISTRRFVVQ